MMKRMLHRSCIAAPLIWAACSLLFDQAIAGPPDEKRSCVYNLQVACRFRDVGTIIELLSDEAFLKAISPPTATEKELQIRDALILEFAKSRTLISAADAERAVSALASAGADINYQDHRGRTALYFLVRRKEAGHALAVLNAGANPNTKTNSMIGCLDEVFGVTPLHEAWWSKPMRDALVERAADENAKDSRGLTPADWLKIREDAKALGF